MLGDLRLYLEDQIQSFLSGLSYARTGQIARILWGFSYCQFQLGPEVIGASGVYPASQVATAALTHKDKIIDTKRALHVKFLFTQGSEGLQIPNLDHVDLQELRCYQTRVHSPETLKISLVGKER